jgi:DNA polymerase III subunit epsilon
MSDAAHTVSSMDSGAPAPSPEHPSPAPEWSRLLGVFDLETTGLDVEHDRIVTAHVGLLDGEGGVIDARTWLADPGIDIPAAAATIHGIDTVHARAFGRDAAEVVAEVVEALRALFDAAIPVVAYNAPFDFSLLKHEALRHGASPIETPFPVVDPLVVDKRYDRYRPGARTLSVVAEHYAVRLDAAHEASADAVAAGRVAQALAGRFGAWMPTGVGELHDRQIGWARDQAARLEEYFVRVGRIRPGDTVDGRWPVR